MITTKKFDMAKYGGEYDGLRNTLVWGRTRRVSFTGHETRPLLLEIQGTLYLATNQ